MVMTPTGREERVGRCGCGGTGRSLLESMSELTRRKGWTSGAHAGPEGRPRRGTQLGLLPQCSERPAVGELSEQGPSTSRHQATPGLRRGLWQGV